MDYFSTGFSIAAILFGIYTFYARVKYPEKFGKLALMRKFWGDKAGYTIHVLGYSVFPIFSAFCLFGKAYMGSCRLFEFSYL